MHCDPSGSTTVTRIGGGPTNFEANSYIVYEFEFVPTQTVQNQLVRSQILFIVYKHMFMTYLVTPNINTKRVKLFSTS